MATAVLAPVQFLSGCKLEPMGTFRRKIGSYLLSGVLVLLIGAVPALQYMGGELARIAGGAVQASAGDVFAIFEFGLSILGIYFVFGYFLYHFSNCLPKSIVMYTAAVLAALGKYMVWAYLWVVRGDLAARFTPTVTPREPHFQLVILLIALLICIFIPTKSESKVYQH